MSVVAGADKFFCNGCTTYKPVADKVKQRKVGSKGGRVICKHCVERCRARRDHDFIEYTVERMQAGASGDYAMRVEDTFPQSILDAYAEAHEAAD